MARSRRQSREAVLQILYQLDVNPDMSAEDALKLYFDQLADQDAEVTPPARKRPPVDEEWVRSVVAAIADNKSQVDERLQNVSRKWRIERMSRVDRNILRLATYELSSAQQPDGVPPQVVINEAIELAKRFGSAEAPAFVNGVLDSAYKAGNF